MKKFNCYFVIQAIVSAAMSFALIACGDDSTSVNDDNDIPKIGDVRTDYDEPMGGAGIITRSCYVYTEEGWVFLTYVGSYVTCEEFVMLSDKCDVDKAAVGDICSFEENGEMKYYRFTAGWLMSGYPMEGVDGWKRISSEEFKNTQDRDKCLKAGTKIGGVCGVYVYDRVTGSVYRDCYLYTEEGWVSQGRSSSHCSEFLINSENYTDVGASEECPAESEGMYKTVVDTLTEYYDGNVMEWTSYYHCESGEWVKTECRDPLDACTADNEGEMKNVVCSQQPDNPKAAKTEWDFVCKDKKWEKMSAEESKTARINAQCTTADTKIGDVCSIVSGGNVSFGIMPNLLTCYVYTEEGWVSKASGSVSSTCEELLNAPADSTETPADSTAAED